MKRKYIGKTGLIILLAILFFSGCVFTSVNQQFDLSGIGRIPFTGIAQKPNTVVFVEVRNFSQPDPAAVDAWVIVRVTRSDSTEMIPGAGGFRFMTTANLAARSGRGDFKYWKRRFVSETLFGQTASICSVLRSWVRIFEVIDGERRYIPIADAGPLVNYTDDVNKANEALTDWLPD